MQHQKVAFGGTSRIASGVDGSLVAEESIVRLAALALETPCVGITPHQRDVIIGTILPAAFEDLVAYHDRDPSVRHKSITCLTSPHSTFFAVVAHRIAHHLIATAQADEGQHAIENAMRLSFYARSQTGTEIHPEATIGRRFVVDHGWGTVIGQTAAIGDDCYLLNNVTLGGRTVANAADGKRHPTIGDRVQICARARIFGPITIGDDSFIGPDVTVLANVPTGVRVLRSFDGHVDHLETLAFGLGEV